jgi:hypothetical protein
MIISEQRLSENNYYSESSNQLDGLKRKLSSENENRNVNNCFSGRPQIIKNFSSNKIHFVENLTTEAYNTYQKNEEIHQDGDQSYINLTPALIQYDKVQIVCRSDEEIQGNMTRFLENEDICSKAQDSNIAKNEAKNYQHSGKYNIYVY